MDQQERCPLFRLPAELRDLIYPLCLTASRGITNPATTLLVAEQDRDIPLLAIALRRTCRRIHGEMDKTIMRTLYEANTFRFTRPMIASWFFDHLQPTQRSLVKGITCVIEASKGPNDSLDAWDHYLTCTPAHHNIRRQCIYMPEMLINDVPHLACLTLDVTDLQDEAGFPKSEAIDTLDALTCLVLRLLQSKGDIHWLSRPQDVRLVCKDASGEIVDLSILHRNRLTSLDGPRVPKTAPSLDEILKILVGI